VIQLVFDIPTQERAKRIHLAKRDEQGDEGPKDGEPGFQPSLL
jgi:hypothetical protein